ncbi:hypothetical protein ACHAW5_008327 [Stephanodiscus triporus]|uniref:PABS domain-containing protein n=1 Tax=Stephanodiscus triporus TaxID=2934178 RepID=A0ABD3PFT9_9STRA
MPRSLLRRPSSSLLAIAIQLASAFSTFSPPPSSSSPLAPATAAASPPPTIIMTDDDVDVVAASASNDDDDDDDVPGDGDGSSDFPPPRDRSSDLLIDGWFHERNDLWPGQAFALKVKEVLYHKRSRFQDVLVFDSESYGRVLVLDGVIQATERDEHSYSEMMAHLPLYSHPNPEKVLVIGGGDGGVLREVARHPSVSEIVICELDADVISVSRRYLPSMAVGFDDPRVRINVMDGARFMDENRGAFDVIITDSSDPVGPASVLFETPFYRAMHGSLRPGGIVCTQGECLWLHLDLIRPLISAITPLFRTVEYAYTTIPSYPSGQIGFVIATKAGEERDGDTNEEDYDNKRQKTEDAGRDGCGGDGGGGCKVPRRVPDEEEARRLRYYTPEVHRAAFVLPAFARRAIFGE